MKLKEFTLKELYQVLLKEDTTLFTKFINDFGINSVETEDKRNLLMNCILEGKENYAKLLIEEGINLEYQDTLGYSALHFAVQENNLNVVQLLIGKNANVNISDNNGNTPLWRGMYDMSDSQIIIELIKAGADIKKKNNHGVSPEEFLEDLPEDVKLWVENASA